jgi:hypothetical protein
MVYLLVESNGIRMKKNKKKKINFLMLGLVVQAQIEA